MSRTLPELRSLTSRLLDWSSAKTGTPSPVAAAEYVLQALSARLDVLVSPAGFNMLVRRALHRAGDTHPVLHNVRQGENGGPFLSGIARADEAEGSQELRTAAEAVISELIELVARLLGADMAVRLVRQSLPDAPLGRVDSGPEDITE